MVTWLRGGVQAASAHRRLRPRAPVEAPASRLERLTGAGWLRVAAATLSATLLGSVGIPVLHDQVADSRRTRAQAQEVRALPPAAVLNALSAAIPAEPDLSGAVSAVSSAAAQSGVQPQQILTAPTVDTPVSGPDERSLPTYTVTVTATAVPEKLSAFLTDLTRQPRLLQLRAVAVHGSTATVTVAAFSSGAATSTESTPEPTAARTDPARASR
jgi:hypothetical protein